MTIDPRPIGIWSALVLAYVVAATVFTWPLALHLDTHIWGDRFDAWTTLWLLWFLHHGVATGTIAELTNLISYPAGYNLWSFGHMALQVLAVPLISAGLSVTAAYNILGIGALAGTATAGHALGRGLTGSHTGGVLAACVLAFNPLLYGEFAVGSIELVAAFFLPLYVWSLVRLAEQPSVKRAAVLAAVLAVTGPFNWYYSIFCILLTPPLALLLAIGKPWRVSARFAGGLVAAGLVVLLLTMPLFDKIRKETPPRIPLSVEVATPEALGRLIDFHDARLELRDLERPELERFDAAQAVINSTTVRTLLRASFSVNPLDSTPGRLAFVMALIGLTACWRKGWRWAVLAALFGLLTLGPFLRWDAGSAPGDGARALPLPYYYLYNYLPYFSKAYRPYRLGIVTITALAALAAYAGPWLRGVMGRWGTAGLLLLTVGLFATQPHWSQGQPSKRGLSATDIPAVYRKLSTLPEGALIELPLHFQPAHLGVAHFQYYQIAHARPLLNNNQLIRIDGLLELRDLARQNALIGLLLELDDLPPDHLTRVKTEDVRALREAGFRLIAVHEAFPADPAHLTGLAERTGMLPAQAFALIDDLFGPAILDEDGVRFYDLERGVRGAVNVPVEPRTWMQGDLGGLDAFETGHIPTLLPSGTALEPDMLLGTAPQSASLRNASLWVRGFEGTGLAFIFMARDGSTIGRPVEIDLEPGSWHRAVAHAPAQAAAVGLINTSDAPLSASMTRAWLEIEPTEPSESISAIPVVQP